MLTDGPPRKGSRVEFLESDRTTTLDLPQNGSLPDKTGGCTVSPCARNTGKETVLGAHVAKLHMTGLGIESWMPGHQEMKRMQFAWCFHNAQVAISSND
jgi:hypothetical protein